MEPEKYPPKIHEQKDFGGQGREEVTVIAWDGKTLATDKQATNHGLRFTVIKSMKLDTGEVLAWSGNMDTGQMIANWYMAGADAAKWPECQKDKDDWARLIVLKEGKVSIYEQRPVAMIFEDQFMAWGSGRDYAMGAMAMGADAKKAVEIATRFDNGCGMGIDVYEAQPMKKQKRGKGKRGC